MVYDAQQANLRLSTAANYRKRLYPADKKRDELIRKYNANTYASQLRRVKPYQDININEILGKNANKPIGYINIPAINLKAMPIYYGTSNETLSKDAGVMPFTSLPAPGQYTTSSVTGHTGMANRIFLIIFAI